jgi:NADH:ubiquinone oxidoreductase subunit 5 (subunit L)/multisubunit Na+/H+ antiporter MnhA subunit
MIFVEYNSVNYATAFALTPIFSTEIYYFLNFDFDLIFIICFLFIGTVGKSVQLGLHTRLPDTMGGPTPVSALIQQNKNTNKVGAITNKV